MKILIELFDKEPVENVCAAAALLPERVVYLGDTRLMTEKQKDNIRRFYKNRGMTDQIIFYEVGSDDPLRIASALKEAAARVDDCVIDVTGGTDLLLVAAGALAAEQQLPIFFINIHTGEFVNIHGCEALAERFTLPSLTVEDLMILAGGSFIRHGHYSKELDDPENEKVAKAVWRVIREDLSGWNRQAAYFQQAAKTLEESEDALDVRAPSQIRLGHRDIVRCSARFMRRFEEAGAIKNYRSEKGEISFSYKSTLFRRLLSDAGVWLELYTYYTAKDSGFFDALKTSVLIDWDGKIEPTGTVNELDDILVKGITPLFISCKLGVPSLLALIEIDTLTRRFGGSLAEPVLVTATPLHKIPEATRQRAADMGITLIGAGELSENEFARKLKELTGGKSDYFKRR